jgi:predicted RNA polymerase sigma factor
MSTASREVERVARQSARRLIAYLAARSRDVAAAEDALADAFAAALQSWPSTGLPDNPEAWLLTTARRRLIDAARHRAVHDQAAASVLAAADEAIEGTLGGQGIPDRRLALLFACAHPALALEVHTPLMLQVVMGVDVARMAGAFLLKPATLGQRLSRAKAKLRDAGVPFEEPEAREMPARLPPVLEAIYAAYGTGWDDVAGASDAIRGLAIEAIELGETLCALQPDEPEVLGLLALMLLCESRRAARRSTSGAFVPLLEQDTTLWSEAMIERADQLLAVAATHRRMGRFQLEAAVQSVHAQRRISHQTDWAAVALLYEGLLSIGPTLAHRLGHAAAVGQLNGPAEGLAALERIDALPLTDHQPYWALRGELLLRAGRHDDALAALRRAAALSTDEATGRYLLGKAAVAHDRSAGVATKPANS